MLNTFNLVNTPTLYFGNGQLTNLPGLAKAFGEKAVLVTGARSFLQSTYWPSLTDQFKTERLLISHHIVSREPSPSMVDEIVNASQDFQPDMVIAIGGGSVIDAGKAIAAMIPVHLPVRNYLEGVGTKNHPGSTLPFIAIPTTSGTGSEATKNAVISEVGDNGFKKSLRHNNFVPDIALIDPALIASCPPSITATSGMDTFTQLLESYVSTKANPITDALAYEGLRLVSTSLPKAFENGENIQARSDMALASYLSGITLANAGLGLVHGFASPIGAYFDIAHGAICSILMAPVNKITIKCLRKQDKNKNPFLHKFSQIGKLFNQNTNHSDDYYIDFFIDLLGQWTYKMNIPQLQTSGVNSTHFEKIIAGTSNKNNPVELPRERLEEILEAAL